MPTSEVFNMDCMEGMAKYPDKYFELAIVDPPYGIGFSKYNGTTYKKGVNKSKKGFANKKLYKKKEWDNNIPEEIYFKELLRISKNQIIWGGNYFTEFLYPTKSWIFWDKKIINNTIKNYADGELAWTSFDITLRKFTYDWIGLGYCNSSEKGSKIHPTQKPVALYKWLLSNYAKQGDKILDTHLGSGSSRIAAYDLGFDFTGFELDKDYFEAQEKRFNDFKAQLKLF